MENIQLLNTKIFTRTSFKRIGSTGHIDRSFCLLICCISYISFLCSQSESSLVLIFTFVCEVHPWVGSPTHTTQMLFNHYIVTICEIILCDIYLGTYQSWSLMLQLCSSFCCSRVSSAREKTFVRDSLNCIRLSHATFFSTALFLRDDGTKRLPIDLWFD